MSVEMKNKIANEFRNTFGRMNVGRDEGNEDYIRVKCGTFNFKVNVTEMCAAMEKMDDGGDDFLRTIITNLSKGIDVKKFVPLYFCEWEEVTERLFVRCIPLSKINPEDVYITVDDIAVTLYILVDDTGSYLMSTRASKQMLRYWGVDKDEAFKAAYGNMMKSDQPCLLDISDLEGVLSGKKKLVLDEEDPIQKEDLPKFGLCLTLENATNGAVAIFMPGVMEKLYELLESDYYLCFTSIHECMVHAIGVGLKATELLSILTDTIDEATSENEVLTKSVYRYFHTTGGIHKVDVEEEDNPKEM